MFRKLSILFIFSLLMIFGWGLSTAQADGETPTVSDDQINAVARQLYCPVCENTPLDVCPTTACAQWRDLIGEKLSLGWTSDQIKDYFVTQYGDRVLAEPPRHGLNWLVYILPPAIILIGGGFLALAIKKMRTVTTKPDVQIVQTKNEDAYISAIEKELKNRRGSS